MSIIARRPLPLRKPTYRFALTPLADAMFQLLIFFMLASSLNPYAMLTVQSSAAAPDPASAPGTVATPGLQPDASAGTTALWTVDAGRITVGGQTFGFDRLADLAAALGTATSPAEVILIMRPGAQVQDMTLVLEALQTAKVTSVQVTSGAL